MSNVADETCGETKHTFCVQQLFFSKILPFMR